MADNDNKDQTEMDPADVEEVEDVEEEETGEDVNSKARQLTAQMMQNPQVLAALQERLDGLVGSPSGYMESLPKAVKRRVNALKNLQVKCAHIEAQFYEEVHELERKYAALYQPLFDKRSDVIRAVYEPTDEECEWKAGEEETLTVSKYVQVTIMTVASRFILKLSCQIDWTKGKNVTLKTIKKKQKHKGRGTVRTITKTVPNDSFFNFFSPPEGRSAVCDEDSEAILAADFEIGHFLRERIIPRAVLYFTGEAIEDDDDDYDEEGEEADDEEGEEEADEENDPDYDPKKDANPPAECKQQ
ncbi:nucleosome assembly protein 1-like 1 isoform X1 [Arapaima gigas]